MNPFDLPGPAFLLFYLVLGLLVCAALWFAARRAPDATLSRLEDPYLVALLRGGREEALRVAVMALVDRGLIELQGTAHQDAVLTLAAGKRPPYVQRKIEHEVLDAARDSTLVHLLPASAGVSAALDQYERQLTQAHLLPDAAVKAERWTRYAIAAALLGGVAAIKIAIGLSRNRPVTLLSLEAVVLLAVAAVVAHPRLTGLGYRALADLKTLFGGLPGRASSIQGGGATAELVWLGAVFGFQAVPDAAFPSRRLLVAPASSSSDSGSSCGSSGSSCGSSCGGGGGCGGCGS